MSPAAIPAPARINTAYVLLISLAAAMGGLLFGYDFVVIGGAKPFYEKFFAVNDPTQQGWAMSCALVGCLLGASLSGVLSDRFGRKRLLILTAAMFAVSSIGVGLAHSFAAFVIWRMLGGVAIGLASSLSPMYIAEVSPAELRGKLVSLNQLTIVIGILSAQIANWIIADAIPAGATAAEIVHSWNTQSGWRWMFAATALPSALFFFAMLAVPESPRWLVKVGGGARARVILARIGGEAYAAAALTDIRATLDETQAVDLGSLLSPKLRKPLLLGVVLAVLQQWCGINVIFNYAEEVFSAAGYNLSSMLLNIVITGTVNLLFTFLAIGVVDGKGRRPLMLIGFAGLAVIYLVLGALFQIHSRGIHMLFLVVSAIGCFAMSLGPVTWVIISEVFPNRIRGTAIAIAVASLWIACFALTYTFPMLNRGLGAAATFWIYAGICIVGFLFVKSQLPETKGRTLEEIEQDWR